MGRDRLLTLERSISLVLFSGLIKGMVNPSIALIVLSHPPVLDLILVLSSIFFFLTLRIDKLYRGVLLFLFAVSLFFSTLAVSFERAMMDLSLYLSFTFVRLADVVRSFPESHHPVCRLFDKSLPYLIFSFGIFCLLSAGVLGYGAWEKSMGESS